MCDTHIQIHMVTPLLPLYRWHSRAADYCCRSLCQCCSHLVCHVRVAVVKGTQQHLAPHGLVLGTLHTCMEQKMQQGTKFNRAQSLTCTIATHVVL